MRLVADALRRRTEALGLPFPYLIIEPGRSVVGPAGATLYTVGGVKRIPGVRDYVRIDGGMTDNPRYALYQAAYTAVVADGRTSLPTGGSPSLAAAARAAISFRRTPPFSPAIEGTFWRCWPPALTTIPCLPTTTACPVRRWC